MVVGIGIGTELAINGAVSHAFNDVIFKGLLFMTMGAVLHRTGKINGSELGGLYKSMPWTTGFCIVGAASISAFPLFSGFVSKSMVMVAALEEGHSIVWLMLLFASAGVFHHAGIKIPFFAFFAHDSGIRTKEAPWNMLIAMGFASALCIFNGSYPAVLYSLLPYQVDYVPYDGTHVLAQMQLLFFSALAFVWLQRTGLYPPELMSVNLDSDWFYRHLLKRLIQRVGNKIGQVNHQLNNQLINVKRLVTRDLQHYFSPTSLFGGTVKTGVAVAWISVLLLIVLLVAFLNT
jgi:multicomponent Na+:H+ antiporter subunit D